MLVDVRKNMDRLVVKGGLCRKKSEKQGKSRTIGILKNVGEFGKM